MVQTKKKFAFSLHFSCISQKNVVTLQAQSGGEHCNDYHNDLLMAYIHEETALYTGTPFVDSSPKFMPGHVQQNDYLQR